MIGYYSRKTNGSITRRYSENYGQRYNSASEVAIMILRINDFIASSGKNGSIGSAGGMPPGMSGMY